ncbi:MAG: zinc ABC transporter substrate-binding protein [Parcubacteria group bacterium]|nr:zinc ABC transporter substrate-binding protein [Parcubacteria group bacterium]
MNRKAIIFFILALFFIGLAFISVKNFKELAKPALSGKLQVAASFYPLYFFSRQIGGDKAEVANIMPAGAEPHDYEPTALDLAKLENSRLIILNGNGLEAWGDNLKKIIDHKKTKIITVETELDATANVDPHVWLSPPLAKNMVDKIAQGFEQTDPLNKDYYEANVKALKDKLNSLDMAYKQTLSNCSQKNIIASHAAFGYLAKAYGFNQRAITGLTPDIEPTPAQLVDITKFARDNQIKYIFFESLASPKLAQTVAREIGADTLELNPLEGLSQEELAQGKNYFSIMQDNLTNLKTALQCQN